MQTDHTIHKSFNHAYTHKMAAYNHMINRLSTITKTKNKKDSKEEFNTIKYIAKQNSYNPGTIYKIYRKMKQKK